MTVPQDYPTRTSSHTPVSLCLEDKFEILKEIGDGSFGSVALARVRTAGAYIARRGSLVSITFYSMGTANDKVDCCKDNEEDL